MLLLYYWSKIGLDVFEQIIDAAKGKQIVMFVKIRMDYSGKDFVKMSQPNPGCWYISHTKCFIALFDLLQVLLRSVL